MGLEALRFGLSENVFRSENPEHDCYCTKLMSDETGKKSCFLDGTLDVQSCLGVPVLLSLPHFLYADQTYFRKVKGISSPNKDEHEIYLLVEPNTGTPLQGMKRVQMNMILRPITFLEYTKNLPRAVYPLLWLEEGASLTPDLVDEINSKLFKVKKIATYFLFALMGVVSVAIVASSTHLVRTTFLLKR
ncbi:unnamed protein product [Acanthoscelides obtectus]|nr:unnamed protein product [Acanthoscelides obtectus]CAK1657640.1 Sensory neuron membrane protein 2 [Acanthoscelides obtectus]